MHRQKILFIINPISGSSKKKNLEGQIDDYIDHNKYVVSIKHTEYTGHAIAISTQAIENDYNIIVAVGGDGTINEIASCLVHTDVTLAIIPMGSGNGFANHINVPKNIQKALEIINHGEQLLIDTCSVNEQFFINVSGVGFDGYISRLIKGKSRRGFMLYFIKTVKGLLSYKPNTYCIKMDDQKEIKNRFYCIAVANASNYGYKFKIAPSASLTDGLLDIVFIKNAPLYKHLLSIKYFIMGNLEKLNHIETTRAKTIEITGAMKLDYHNDGEGFQTRESLRFKVNPKSLNIIINRA